MSKDSQNINTKNNADMGPAFLYIKTYKPMATKTVWYKQRSTQMLDRRENPETDPYYMRATVQ